MNLIFKYIFDFYVKRLSTLFYVLALFAILFTFDNQFKIKEHYEYEFSYGNIISPFSSISLPKLDNKQNEAYENIINQKLIPTYLSQHHKSFIDKNDIDLKIDLNIKRDTDLINSYFILKSKSTSDFDETMFINYLSSFEEYLMTLIKKRYFNYLNTVKEVNNIKINDFFNRLIYLSSEGLLNSSISIETQLADGTISHNLNKTNVTSNKNFLDENFLSPYYSIDSNFDFINFDFKNQTGFYNYNLIVRDRSNLKNRIKLALIICFILIILIHPIIINQINEYVAKIRR